MRTNIENNLLLSSSLVKSMQNLSPDLLSSSELTALSIIKETIPTVNTSTQENIDLVVRPLAMVIAVNEMLLQNLFSETTIEGIITSSTIGDELKAAMLSSFAKLNGISIASSTHIGMGTEITYALNNKGDNLVSVLRSIVNDPLSKIKSLAIIDSTCPELIRNKVAYVQLDTLKAMDFARDDQTIGTLRDGGYDRRDRLKYEMLQKSERISIPGMVDVIFTSDLIKEAVTVTPDTEGIYSFPDGYYMSMDTSDVDSDQYVVLVNDAMTEGITKFNPKVFALNQGPLSFNTVRYSDPLFVDKVDDSMIEVVDPLYKGAFPLFVDLKLYTKKTIDFILASETIEAYLARNDGNMELISPSEIREELLAVGIDGYVSTTNAAKLYQSLNSYMPQTVTFPLTMKDIVLFNPLVSGMFSKRTISVFLGTLQIEVE